MSNLSYDYKKNIFPNDWDEISINEVLELIERPIGMNDDELYDLVTVRRNFGAI